MARSSGVLMGRLIVDTTDACQPMRSDGSAHARNASSVMTLVTPAESGMLVDDPRRAVCGRCGGVVVLTGADASIDGLFGQYSVAALDFPVVARGVGRDPLVAGSQQDVLARTLFPLVPSGW